MREGRVDGFETELWRCARVGTVEEAVAAIRTTGGEFLTWEPNGYRLGLDPGVRPDAEGNLFPGAADFRHPALRMDQISQLRICSLRLPADTPPWAGMYFIKEDRLMNFSQCADPDDQRLVDPMALGQLLLLSTLCPLTLPAYGWIDERGANLPNMRTGGLGPSDLRFVFWANVFGPEYVAHLGRDFLLEAPGWQLRPSCPAAACCTWPPRATWTGGTTTTFKFEITSPDASPASSCTARKSGRISRPRRA